MSAEVEVRASSRRASSRRALLGLGAALAAGAIAGESLAAADPAEAAPAKRAFVGRQYPTASAAAAAARGARSAVFAHDPREHLLRRATFGPRPADRKRLKRLGIDAWLDLQLHPGRIDDGRAKKAVQRFPLAFARPAAVVKGSKRYSWDAGFQTGQATLARQVFSDRQLYEVVVDVFADHLHVPVPSEQWHTGPGYVRDVIRAHAFGRFEDMLQAAMRHPAMLSFLSNDESDRRNVNENLGRELLELHTVGLQARYSEKDVRASAGILSGRTWDWKKGVYRFDPDRHVTGRLRVLGFSHPNRPGQGEAVGDAYLRYLAHHPATARTIARKLAIRFVSDTPSADLVNRLARVYLRNGTDIRAVVTAVFRSSDFWHAVGTRMRRPLEDAVGALRVLDVKPAAGMRQPLEWLYWNLDSAGHAPLRWAPPNGYPDVAAAWLGAGAMLQRWDLHRAFVHGWWPKLTWTKPSRLVKRTDGMTTVQWAAAVGRRLTGTTPKRAHLVAAVRGAGLEVGAPAPVDDWTCGKVAALLLDSPYFQLR
ncbi:DUF1800 domain-containing protein [Amnibacterium endophyticum]|uniref:DUF1800 domain-containing protein n=1 Tax=Amnibacterium endophyticum TaxID=2109337 RepID=A0ABW4LIJ3_9MICO